jgi:hypothetical protein
MVQPPTQDEEQVSQDAGMNLWGAHEEKDKEEEVPQALQLKSGHHPKESSSGSDYG